MIRELPVHPVHAPVRHLILYLTNQCNLRCTYCFVAKDADSMSRETARRTVDFFFDKNISGNQTQLEITFFGGEPFMRTDLMEEVVAYARQPRPGLRKQVTFAATTNATLASPRIERLIRDARMQLLISLDGDEQASQARPFMNGRPSHALAARNLPKLVEWAQWSSVRMTYHPGSLDLLANVRHSLELGAPSVVLAPVVESDWSGCLERLEEAFEELSQWFLTECRAGRVPPLEVHWLLLRQWHRVLRGGSRPARTCPIGHTLLAVTVEGQVLPCHRFLNHREYALGTVEHTQLSSERWKYVHLSSRDILGCAGCLAEPICGGGCRVLSLEAGQGLTGTHPDYCVLTRLQARHIYRLYDTLQNERNPIFQKLVRRPGPLAAGVLQELVNPSA